MPWFNSSSLKPSNAPPSFYEPTEDRHHSGSKKKGGFFSKSEDKRAKSKHQPPPQNFTNQALKYGMDFHQYREQQLKEQRIIEKKMEKQTGRKSKSSSIKSRKEDVETAFKIGKFFKKSK